MSDKDVTPIEAIDYESLQKPAEQNQDSEQNVKNKSIFWIVLVLLILCVLMVFLFLPEYVAEKRQINSSDLQTQSDTPPTVDVADPEPSSETSVEPTKSLTAEELSALRQEAEILLLQIIEKQKFLESKAVKKWGLEEFRNAISLGASGDEHYRKQEYKQAITSYNDTVNLLSKLEKQVAPTLTMHLEKGELALIQAEKIIAIQHFELAKSIDEKNTQAINGLKRASTIEELYSLLEKGGKLEAANRFSDAKNTYAQATELDPLSLEAKEALNRVKSRLAELEFTRMINQGYASLKLRQYGDARAAFKTAQELFPNSDKPKQGLARIERAILEEKIASLTAEAQHFENAQNWTNAANSYQQLLALNPNSASAQQGLQRNQEREQILSSLTNHIENKLRLSSDSVANDAKKLLNKIELLDNPGSKIEQGALTLQELLVLANRPILITLHSDNQTDVAIYKVGKFGKFDSREVELKPGKYTIVGSRSGFRDVRKVVTIMAEMTDTTIQVRCEEPI